MTAQERIEALLATQLFGNASAEALKLLATHAIERRLHQGEILFVGGETARGLYVAVSDALRAFRESEEGREQTIHVERAGATFAEVPVFDNGPFPSTVMAEEESVVLFLAKEDVQRFLLLNPEAALAALGVLAGGLRKITLLLEQLSLQDVTPTAGDDVGGSGGQPRHRRGRYLLLSARSPSEDRRASWISTRSDNPDSASVGK